MNAYPVMLLTTCALTHYAAKISCCGLGLVVLSLACSGQQSRCHRYASQEAAAPSDMHRHRRSMLPMQAGAHRVRAAATAAPKAPPWGAWCHHACIGLQGRAASRSARQCYHLLVYFPSVRRRTSCSTASSGTDSLSTVLPTGLLFPQKAQEAPPVLGRRSVAARAVSQRWTFQGSPGVLARCTTHNKVVLMSAESQPVRLSCAITGVKSVVSTAQLQ
jgi:hypothetical protein